MTYLKLSSKNQLVLPKEARAAMKVKGGDSLLVVVKGDITILMPKPRKYADALAGLGKDVYYRGSRRQRSYLGARAVPWLLRCPQTPRSDRQSLILAHRQSRVKLRFTRSAKQTRRVCGVR